MLVLYWVQFIKLSSGLRYKWIALVYDTWAKQKWNYSCSILGGANELFALILGHLFSFRLNSHCVQPKPTMMMGRLYITVVGCVSWSIWHFTCGIVCGLVDFVASRYMYGCQSVAVFGSYSLLAHRWVAIRLWHDISLRSMLGGQC